MRNTCNVACAPRRVAARATFTLLGGGCVYSTDWAEQTNGRHLPPEIPPLR